MPTTPDLVIAPLDHEDAGELLTLQRAAYATEAQTYDDPHLPALVQSLDELVAGLAGGTALKAVRGHRIVGAVRARVESTRGVLHVSRLVVAPDQQGHGIGRALLDAVERAAPPDVRTAALFTGERSAANLRLYARAGYVERRREPLPGSTSGVVLVHLVKDLPDR